MGDANAPVPLELVWCIALYAGNVLHVRLLCRAARALRPERSVLHRCWAWLREEDFQDYDHVGHFLSDLYDDLEPLMWGPERRLPPKQRARLRRPCAQRLLYREPLAHVPRYRVRAVHEIYRIPLSLVRHLRYRKRWQVLALM